MQLNQVSDLFNESYFHTGAHVSCLCCNACQKMALGEGDWGEGTVLSANIWSASDMSKYMLHTNIFFMFSPNTGTVPKAIVAKHLWEESGLSWVFRYQLELKRIVLYWSIVYTVNHQFVLSASCTELSSIGQSSTVNHQLVLSASCTDMSTWAFFHCPYSVFLLVKSTDALHTCNWFLLRLFCGLQGSSLIVCGTLTEYPNAECLYCYIV